MFKRLSTYFLQGLIFLAPIGITVYIFYEAFIKIDSWLGLPIRGIGFLITIAGVTIIGFLTSNFLTKRLLQLVEEILIRLPFVRLLYSALKDVLTAFVGEQKRFDKPVIVDLIPGAGMKAFGFVTRGSLDRFDMQDQVAVYFPQSFNFAGNLLIFPRDQVKPIETESSKLMAFIVSGGVTE
jgi:uncharacterized membrane protein